MRCPFRLIACLSTLALTATAFAADPALPPIKTAGYDAHGGFVVNGKPFFPILIYDAPTDAATLKQLHESGFNVVTCAPEAAEALPAQGFYSAVHAGKKVDKLGGVLLVVGADSPARYFKDNLIKQTTEANAKVHAFAPGRPVMNAIGFWDNEPAGVIAGKVLPKATYDDLVAHIDVAAPYLYPVPYQPVSTVGDAVARAHAATAGKKPVLPILQVFTWDAKARYPSPAELRCMVYLSLVEGADGIGYYSYGSVTGQPKKTIAEVQPELWQSVGKLNVEIANIGPRLERGQDVTAAVLKGLPKGVAGKAVRDGSTLLAVIVNPTAEKADLAITPPTGYATPKDLAKTIEPMSVLLVDIPKI
jgi:hypothetical protein